MPTKKAATRKVTAKKAPARRRAPAKKKTTRKCQEPEPMGNILGPMLGMGIGLAMLGAFTD